jgi:hypothetical protein
MPTTVEYKAVVKRAMELWADPAFRTREVMEGANNALCAVEVLRVSHGQITGRLVGRGARMMNHHPRQPHWPELEKALAPIVQAMGYRTLEQLMNNNDWRDQGQDHIYNCMATAHERLAEQLVRENSPLPLRAPGRAPASGSAKAPAPAILDEKVLDGRAQLETAAPHARISKVKA